MVTGKLEGLGMGFYSRGKLVPRELDLRMCDTVPSSHNYGRRWL